MTEERKAKINEGDSSASSIIETSKHIGDLSEEIEEIEEINMNKSTASSRSSAADGGSEISERGQRTNLNINKGYLCAFVDTFRTPEFKAKYNYKHFNIDTFVTWIEEEGGSSIAPRPLAELYQLSVTKRDSTMRLQEKKQKKKAEKKGKSVVEQVEEPTVHGMLNTMQVRQIMRASLAVHSYSENDERVYQLFSRVFKDMNTSPRFLVGTVYLNRVLGGRVAGKLPMAQASKLEALLYFHCIRLYMNSIGKIDGKIGNRIGYALQKIVDCWSRLISNVRMEDLGRLSVLIMPYIIYESERARFRVLKSRAEGYSNSDMETTLVDCHVVNEVANVSAKAWNRTDEADTALRYIVDMMFTHLETLISRQYLYNGDEKDILKWNEMQKYKLPPSVTEVPKVFAQLPEAIVTTLQVEVPEAPEISREGNADDNVVHSVSSEEENDGDGNNANSGKGHKRGQLGGRSDQSNKRQKQTSSAEPTERVVIKNEPINTTIRPGRDGERSEETDQAYQTVNRDMFNKFAMLDVDMENLIGSAMDLAGVDLNANVDLLLTDPPYNIRKEGGRTNSEYDQFTENDMEELIEFAATVLKKGGHGIIFCSFSQFPTYHKLLQKHTEKVLDFDKDPTGNTYSVKDMFQVEPSPIVYVKRDGHFNNPLRKSFNHVNVVEISIHFWRNGGSEEESKSRIDYNTPTEFGGVHPSWTNVVTDVPIPSGSEIVYYPNTEPGQTRRRFRPEQKPVSLIKHIISKYTTGGDIVVDTCAGTFSTVKACMELNQHRRAVCSDIDENCSLLVEDDVIELYSKQLLNQHSDLTTADIETRQAAQLICQEVARRAVKERSDAWKTPPGLVPIQNFPPHVVQYICQYWNDFTLYPNRHISMNRWNSEWIQRMNSIDCKALLSYEAQKLNLTIKPSTVKHPNAGLGVFAGKAFAEGDILGYYYGALIYGDIGAERRLHKRYGTGVLSVSSADFDKWATKLDHVFVDANGDRYDGFVGPAPFCVCRYINDPRYISGDKDKEKKDANRAPNVMFMADNKATGNRDFERYNAIHVIATADIRPGQELFVPYGSNYVFPSN